MTPKQTLPTELTGIHQRDLGNGKIGVQHWMILQHFCTTECVVTLSSRTSVAAPLTNAVRQIYREMPPTRLNNRRTINWLAKYRKMRRTK